MMKTTVAHEYNDYDSIAKEISQTATKNMSSENYMQLATDIQKSAISNAEHILQKQVSESDGSAKSEEHTFKGILYVFISKSVPLKTLRVYAKELSKIGNGAMVLNGFVGGSNRIKPTMRFTASILKHDQTCTGGRCKMYKSPVDINPILFRKYGIKRVPAFVYSPVEQEAFCDEDLIAEQNSIVVYGDSDIYYALEQINRVINNEEIDSILEKKNKI